MNKADLIVAIAEKTGLTKKNAAVALDATLEAITDALKAREDVRLIGFGSFELRYRIARPGRNPKTGETVEIPPSVVPAFRAGKDLKDAVN